MIEAVHDLIIQPDGKIVAVGEASQVSLVRYNQDGSLDSAFGSAGKIITDVGGNLSGAHSVVLQTDEKIAVFGTYNGDGSDRAFLVRYNLS